MLRQKLEHNTDLALEACSRTAAAARGTARVHSSLSLFTIA